MGYPHTKVVRDHEHTHAEQDQDGRPDSVIENTADHTGHQGCQDGQIYVWCALFRMDKRRQLFSVFTHTFLSFSKGSVSESELLTLPPSSLSE